MPPLTLAVLSDLHIGHDARGRDLCPHADSKAIDPVYKDTFFKFLRSAQIRADYLVIPGDITHEAQPAEFDLASNFIADTARVLGTKKKKTRVIIVPGNHDVDWAEMSLPDSTGFRQNQRYAPLRNGKWIFGRIMRSGGQCLLDPPYFRIWDFADLLVLAYNSAWHDDPKISTHHGLIAADHIQQLERKVGQIDLSSSRLKLFLAHHHPVQYSDPIPDEPDFSAMTNAGNLLALLRKNHFDVLIHGHKHVPNFGTYVVDASFPLVILGAGSFSAMLDTRWSGLVNNQFHIVTVEGRDTKTGYVFGFVQSWTYLCSRGWVPSEPYTGIRHRLPFGSHVQPNEIKSALAPILERRLRDKEYVEWSVVLSDLPHVKYVPPEQMTTILKALSEVVGFRIHGALPNDVILLKGEPRDA